MSVTVQDRPIFWPAMDKTLHALLIGVIEAVRSHVFYNTHAWYCNTTMISHRQHLHCHAFVVVVAGKLLPWLKAKVIVIIIINVKKLPVKFDIFVRVYLKRQKLLR